MQKTILIIEDDSNIRELLRLYLSQEGYKIETAQDGMEGLRAFRAHEPDLILLDGGSGQIAAVAPILQKYALDIPLYGLVKDDRHRTRAIALSGGEIAIHRKRAAFTLLANIQEEVHRSAIRYHRQRRKGASISTTLTEIEGIGPTRAKALLRQFGSLKGVQNASVEELLLVKGMTRPAAEAIERYFQSKG